jgi:hypothetical protein
MHPKKADSHGYPQNAHREGAYRNALERRLNFQARDQRVVDFIHTARVSDVLQVGTHGQPVGDVEAVVDLVVVFGFANRRDTGLS